MTKRSLSLGAAVLAVALLCLPVLSQAQERQEMSADMAAMMEAYEEAGTPGEVHEALARTAGTWNLTVKMWMDPSGEPTVSEATSVIEPVMGGRFVKETVEGDFMGAPFRGVALVGYNNTTGECEGVWYDNRSTALYTYKGSINEAGDELTLKSRYKDPATGQWVENRSVRKIQGDRITETAWEIRDGQEQKVMELTYTRR